MIRPSFPTGKKQPGFWHPNNSMSIILFLVFLFVVFSVIYTDSVNASSEQQRRLAYGSWHVAAYGTDQETLKLLQSHATVQAAGFMEIYGTITDGAKNEIGWIGYADPNVISVGNIMLLDGRFPDKEDEIAVEASCLTRLGIEKQPGQQISVTVSWKDGQNVPQTEIQSYKLCGIVQNYSKNWKYNGNPLPSFFVCPNALETARPAAFHVFAQMKPEFASDAASLSALCSWNSSFTRNDFTYLQYTKEGAHTPVFSVWQMILLLSGTLFTLTLTQANIRQSYHSFLMLRTLGASRKQILFLFLQSKAKVIGISSISGILCGMLATRLISLLPGDIPAWPDICSFQAWHLLRTILCLYVGIILSITVSLIPLLHLPLYKTPQKQPINIMAPIRLRYKREQQKSCQDLPVKFRNGRHPITALFRTADRRQDFFQAALIFIVAIIIYFLAYQAWNAGCIYLKYQKDFPEDYTFGNLSSYTSPHSVITEDDLMQIQHTYGVKNAIGVAVSNNCEIIFLDEYDRQYADQVRSFLEEKGSHFADTAISGMFIGFPDTLLSVYAGILDSGASNLIPKKDEVILYLPDYCVLADGSLSDPDKSHGTQILSEHTIEIGDEIQVETGGELKKLSIIGIIRSIKETLPESYCLTRPYSIICSLDTYRSIFGQAEYAFIQVYQDPTAISYQTAIELSNQENGLYFHNKRAERILLSQNTVSQTMLALLLSTFGFLAAMSIRFALYSFYGKQISKRYRTLHRLGMPKSSIRKILFQKAFSSSLAGCGTAAIVFLAADFARSGKGLFSLANYGSQNPGIRQILLDMAVNYAHDSDWLFIAFLIIGVFLLNFLMLAFYDYRNIRSS